MQSDPFVEWQRLTELYRGMCDDELRELAADSADLTDVARQVLHDEMKKRGLKEPLAAGTVASQPAPPAAPQWGPEAPPPDAADAQQESGFRHDFTWKTLLCECDEQEEARQICAALRQAGIESWIEGRGYYSPYSQLDLRNPRILVAADRLEEALAVAARPIPQEIIEQTRTAEPDFEPPVCPKCGAADPVLEGVDPFNAWRCDTCGNQWTEPAENPASGPDENPEESTP
jgi:ribosomal protein L37AE/L43A